MPQLKDQIISMIRHSGKVGRLSIHQVALDITNMSNTFLPPGLTIVVNYVFAILRLEYEYRCANLCSVPISSNTAPLLAWHNCKSFFGPTASSTCAACSLNDTFLAASIIASVALQACDSSFELYLLLSWLIGYANQFLQICWFLYSVPPD